MNRRLSLLVCLLVLQAGCRTTPDSEAITGNGDSLVQARALNNAVAFQCGDLGTLTIRFPDPETIELDSGDGSVLLQQARSASGARYVKDGLEFWTKGDEALYLLNGVKHECVALKP